jgi:hypothetical protein
MTNTGIKVLCEQLKPLGITRPHIQKLLPSWWEPSMAETPSGLQDVQMKVAKMFNLQASSLLKDELEPTFKQEHSKFKRESTKSHADIELAASLATSTAKLAIKAFGKSSFSPESLGTAQDIRNELLETSGRWIGLDDLVTYCWEKGIIVLHLSLYSSIKRMDGMAININGQPVIVLTSMKKKGFLLFDLAHELAHIALCHLEANSSLIDIELGKGSSAEDNEEKEADRFALEILSGNPDSIAPTTNKKVQLPLLVSWAKQVSLRERVEPCHAILSFAKKNNQWAIAQTALKHHFPRAVHDYNIVKDKSLEYLTSENLKTDEAVFLEKLVLGY